MLTGLIVVAIIVFAFTLIAAIFVALLIAVSWAEATLVDLLENGVPIPERLSEDEQSRIIALIHEHEGSPQP